MNNVTVFAFWIMSMSIILSNENTTFEEPVGKKETPPAKEQSVMERKLQHSQNLLNGLALKDFDKINKEADALIAVRKEATWKINETEQYLRHSNAFDDQLQRIKKAAKEKNLDGATLAYLDLTLTCVKCHETLRVQKKKTKDD